MVVAARRGASLTDLPRNSLPQYSCAVEKPFVRAAPLAAVSHPPTSTLQDGCPHLPRSIDEAPYSIACQPLHPASEYAKHPADTY